MDLFFRVSPSRVAHSGARDPDVEGELGLAGEISRVGTPADDVADYVVGEHCALENRFQKIPRMRRVGCSEGHGSVGVIARASNRVGQIVVGAREGGECGEDEQILHCDSGGEGDGQTLSISILYNFF